MIQRVLEPEIMDTAEAARDYDTMNHTAVNRCFVTDLLAAADGDLTAEQEVLDLGTGTALIPIELCKRAPRVMVHAVDASAEMLDLARANLALAGVYERVVPHLVDAKRQLPFAAGRFSVVMSNSLLHHLPEPVAALRQAWRVTATGGLLFFRDLLRPATEQQLDELVLNHAGDCSPAQRALFAESLRAALTVEEVRELVGEFGAESATVQQTSDRHWTWIYRKQ